MLSCLPKACVHDIDNCAGNRYSLRHKLRSWTIALLEIAMHPFVALHLKLPKVVSTASTFVQCILSSTTCKEMLCIWCSSSQPSKTNLADKLGIRERPASIPGTQITAAVLVSQNNSSQILHHGSTSCYSISSSVTDGFYWVGAHLSPINLHALKLPLSILTAPGILFVEQQAQDHTELPCHRMTTNKCSLTSSFLAFACCACRGDGVRIGCGGQLHQPC